MFRRVLCAANRSKVDFSTLVNEKYSSRSKGNFSFRCLLDRRFAKKLKTKNNLPNKQRPPHNQKIIIVSSRHRIFIYFSNLNTTQYSEHMLISPADSQARIFIFLRFKISSSQVGRDARWHNFKLMTPYDDAVFIQLVRLL